MNDSPTKNAALIDLSKPLSKEEMLAIIQIVRELWRKQFDSDMPDVQIQSSLPTSAFPRRRETTPTLSTAKRTQYHSTPALNKLTADLTDIKDKLKRFSTDRQQAFLGTKSNSKSRCLDQQSRSRISSSSIRKYIHRDRRQSRRRRCLVRHSRRPNERKILVLGTLLTCTFSLEY